MFQRDKQTDRRSEKQTKTNNTDVFKVYITNNMITSTNTAVITGVSSPTTKQNTRFTAHSQTETSNKIINW